MSELDYSRIGDMERMVYGDRGRSRSKWTLTERTKELVKELGMVGVIVNCLFICRGDSLRMGPFNGRKILER